MTARSRIACYFIIATAVQLFGWLHINRLNSTQEEPIRHILYLRPTAVMLMRSDSIIKNVDIVGIDIIARDATNILVEGVNGWDFNTFIRIDRVNTAMIRSNYLNSCIHSGHGAIISKIK